LPLEFLGEDNVDLPDPIRVEHLPDIYGLIDLIDRRPDSLDQPRLGLLREETSRSPLETGVDIVKGYVKTSESEQSQDPMLITALPHREELRAPGSAFEDAFCQEEVESLAQMVRGGKEVQGPVSPRDRGSNGWGRERRSLHRKRATGLGHGVLATSGAAQPTRTRITSNRGQEAQNQSTA